ncbi:MAG: nicotinamide riboside transporter PnuC [Bacteroidales bacterium]|nr:nicotinamide riboside transporter PnuC [Bacteroidales bacterium]
MEIFTLVTGVIYVILEIRQKNFMWIVGMVTSLAAMYMFFGESLYASFGLNCYYFVVSVWGLYQWRRDARKLTVATGTEKPVAGAVVEEKKVEGSGNILKDGNSSPENINSNNIEGEGQTIDPEVGKKSGDVIHLNRLGWKTIVVCAIVFVAGVVLLRFGLNFLKDSMSGLDAAVAVMSAIATFMLARSYISQWLLWIVADLLSTILCAMSGMYWMTALYAVYCLSAVYGYIYWRRHGVYID